MFSNEIFHPLQYDGILPTDFNNPFDYQPHRICTEAFNSIMPEIEKLISDSDDGKMFGVLVVRNNNEGGKIGFLAAFSGQLLGSFVVPGFVPPVFDYLAPDGYFKIHENEISLLNKKIDLLTQDENYIAAKLEAEKELQNAEKVANNAKERMLNAKKVRDSIRAERNITPSEKEAMIRESQFLKAEYRRAQNNLKQLTNKNSEKLNVFEENLTQLRNERRQKSDNLQNWLFEQFIFTNHEGKRSSLPAIFADTAQKVPPSGAGECCEPKLLQYAYNHNFTPIQIAMFWVGKTDAGGLRRHLHHYPACAGKCKPILEFMLPQSVFQPRNFTHNKIEILHEDDDLWVIYKPSGMLSVPGKSKKESVLSELAGKTEPLSVHRLDMDTSGLMLVAKTKRAHFELQKQFAGGNIYKIYYALLEGEPLKKGAKGTISLPLAADYTHRPCQKVDKEHGKSAQTEYFAITEHLVKLHPITGRTHQLRVHCAHFEGLNRPIKGDNLYGNKSDRLYLCAAEISFRHPTTHQTMTFSRPDDFIKIPR